MKSAPPVLGLVLNRAQWLLVLALLYCSSAMAADVIVVANADVPAGHVDRTELRAIYTLRKRLWSNGTPVQVFTLPDEDALQQTFAKDVLHLYPYQLRLLWSRAVFSGTGRAPELVRDVAAMLDAIRTTSGAIGYAPPTDELPPGVKQLTEDSP